MSGMKSHECLIASQRKEKKDLQAKTQKMKHGIPKGDKKKKKEITAEISILIAELDLRHEKELNELESQSVSASALATSTHDGTCSFSVLQESNGSGDMEVSITEKHSSLNQSEKSSLPHDHSENEDCTNNSLFQPVEHYSMAQEEHQATQKLSKAQKRRNKKALMEKEREKAIADQEIKNLNSLRNLEYEKIKKILCERNLAVHEVHSDGDCLYKAIEHQLSILSLQQMTVQNLRQSTSDYMLLHIKDFIPFLTNTETGDVMTEEQYIKYCKDIASTPVWGGHVEVQALSHVCGRSIEVIQADGPSVIAGDENVNPKLILSYHRHVYGLGEHYNSVVPGAKAENI